MSAADTRMLLKSVAVFGAAKTGKSSLVARFLGQAFEESYKPTIEDYHCSKIYSGDMLFHLNIIDTSGSFEFPAMQRLAMEKADAFIFVYSIDDVKSFETVQTGLKRLCEVKDIAGNVPVIVVCNKADLADITALRGLQKKMDDKKCLLAETTHSPASVDSEIFELSNKRTLVEQRDCVLKLGCKFLLTSAKFRWNVNRIFYELFAETELATKNHLTRNQAVVNTMKLMWETISFRKSHSNLHAGTS